MVLGLERIETLPALAQWLAQPQPWVGGFDLPFGLPRELVTTLGWPTDWRACMQHYRSLTREQIREAFAGFLRCPPRGRQVCPPRYRRPRGFQPLDEMGEPARGLHAARLPSAVAGCFGVYLPGRCRPAQAMHSAWRWRPPPACWREVLQRRSYKSDDRAGQTLTVSSPARTW